MIGQFVENFFSSELIQDADWITCQDTKPNIKILKPTCEKKK